MGHRSLTSSETDKEEGKRRSEGRRSPSQAHRSRGDSEAKVASTYRTGHGGCDPLPPETPTDPFQLSPPRSPPLVHPDSDDPKRQFGLLLDDDLSSLTPEDSLS